MVPTTYTPTGHLATAAFAAYAIPAEYQGVVLLAHGVANHTTSGNVRHELARLLHARASELSDDILAIVNDRDQQMVPAAWSHLWKPKGYGPWPLPAPGTSVGDGDRYASLRATMPAIVGRILGYEPNLSTTWAYKTSLAHGQAIVGLLTGDLATEVKALVGDLYDA